MQGRQRGLADVGHDTQKMYARRCEGKMHLQGPWPVSRFFTRLFCTLAPSVIVVVVMVVAVVIVVTVVVTVVVVVVVSKIKQSK